MSWKTTITTMIRHLANDVGSTETFTDERILTCAVVAGLIVSQEYDLSQDYSFNIDGQDITPDPVSSSDNMAVALIALKAACILDLNRYQGAVSTGIRVRDGDSEVDTTSGFKGYADIIKEGPCGAYKKLLSDASFSASMGRGKAVMTPMSHADFSLSSNFDVPRFFNSLIYR